MKNEDFEKFVSAGENEHVEFMSHGSRPEVLAQAVCAFLNTKGGQIFIGVGDEGGLVGVPEPKKVIAPLEKYLRDAIIPLSLWSTEVVEYKNKSFVVLEVPEGSEKPYLCKNVVFIRAESRVKPATPKELSAIIFETADLPTRWERQIPPGAALKDLDISLIRETAAMAAKSNRWLGQPDDERSFLSSLGLMGDNGITNAALVLFGFQHVRWLPQARLRLLVLPEGKAGGRYTSEKLLELNVVRATEQLPELLATYIGGVESTFQPGNWQRSDQPRYLLSAMREGVMNALIHRDYSQFGEITVEVLSNTIKISNPGPLPDALKVSDLKKEHPSVQRNPDIAHICYLRGQIEKLGRGTQRIIDDCKSAYLRQPKWETSRAGTTLTFFAAVTPSKPVAVDELNDRQQKILDALKAKKRLKAGEIPRLLGDNVTDRTVRKDLESLVSSGWVLRRGRGRSISYLLGPMSERQD